MSTVLITGAAKRIGAEIALFLAERGFNIALHCNNSVIEAEKLADRIRLLGVECDVFVADLSSVGGMCELVKSVDERFADFSVLVNSASSFGHGTIAETDEELFDSQIAVNLKAPFFLTREFTGKVERGVVVNIVDTYVNTNVFANAAYLLSKKALTDFTGMAAREFGPNFRINAIAPGLILPSSNDEEKLFEKIAHKLPLQRTGSATHIAKAVAFLIDCDYITGETINVDGGRHLI